MDKLVRRYYQFKMILLTALSKAISIFYRERHWVLHERGTDARDNAYFFYRYLKKKHPEQKVYFIIDETSPDYEKVKEDAVNFGSLKNYWVIATADKIVSTHLYYGLPCMNPKLFRFLKLNQRFIFLQHGITKDDIASLHYDQTGVRVFVCGAKPEFDYVCNEFGYPPGVVQYTGFARYDTLRDVDAKNQILIMPTWRMYISDEDTFLASEYYQQWNQVLNSEALIEYLEKKDLTAVFYPHFELQKYLHRFRSGSERVILADFAHYDVQTLLKESKLLVTDYSSVFFDFAYMRKPVIYFQFDQEAFFSKHYGRGYFSYTKMGFGPVLERAEAVIQAIVKIGENEFIPSEEYYQRMEGFFPLYDQKNCDRIYDAICSL